MGALNAAPNDGKNKKAMKQYGHIPATQPSAQAADGGRRNPVTRAAVTSVRENPCRNTAENLRMCETCINTHTHTHTMSPRASR